MTRRFRINRATLFSILTVSGASFSSLTVTTVEASPLAIPAPLSFDAGPFGKLNVQGVISGYGVWQDNKFATPGNFAGNKYTSADISNGQVIIQKNSGLVQFYLQAGAYNVMTLGANYVSTGNFTQNTFGALPVAYVELAPTSSFNVQIGKLPTLLGAEYAFTYQNINIESGLIRSQENVINKGIQFNYTAGPITASLSWNDGFYSDRFNWLTGMLTWTIDKENSVFFQAGGNLGHTRFIYASLATTPLQNNEDIYAIGYTYDNGPLLVTPYLQYTHVNNAAQLGYSKGESTYGAEILANYSLTDTVSLAGRVEYISSTGTPGSSDMNLTDFGPGAKAMSLTVTPTYQDGGFFARAELGYVEAFNTPAAGIGTTGTSNTQLRGLVETGFMF